MRPTVAHSVRGRLRVRYPPRWFGERRAAVESRLRELRGVRVVEASAVTGSVRIDYDPFELAEQAIVGALHELSSALDPRADAIETVPSRPVRLASATTPPLVNLIGASTALAAACCLPVPPMLTAGLVLAAGAPSLARAGVTLATERRVNGDVLEASTLVLLTLRGNYVAGALLTWLRSLGDYVVARSVTRTRHSLRNVVAAPDQTVTRVAEGQRTVVQVASLRPGDVVAVGAGHPMPVDGTVVDGEALVNQQTMTGEALPVERRAGDPVFAATTVEHGEIDVRVERVGLETAVGRIIQTIEAAADEKSNIQLFAERLADREVARTLTLAGVSAALARSLDAGMAVLVSDYGTAARVGIPTAVVTSLWQASNQGILIKGPRALENLARVNTVVFDKTGTLTSGVPHVTSIARYRDDLDENELIRLVAAAEAGFRHPIARAVARLAREREITVPSATETSQKVGLGVEVRVEGRHVLVGSRRFMESRGIDLTAARVTEAAAHAVGASPHFVAIDGTLAAVLVLQDELRADAHDAVQALRARKMRNVILLTGDHPEPSRVIADLLGLRHHYAELLPEDKARLIRELKAEGRVVAMVGDGVNDALALNEADVGIAVPGGAEVATEAADVVLLTGGLDRVVRALDLSHESVDRVRRTLGIAARANLLVVGLASLGLARPLPSILISHGSAVGAALFNALTADRS